MSFISIIIPTLNRPEDLLKAVNSLCTQTRLPDELIIVDQSHDKLSIIPVKKIMRKYFAIKLVYIHDSKIAGLVEAKQRGVLNAEGDLICFLEDDVILEKKYLNQIELGFTKNLNMIGCSGIITNPPKNNFLYKTFFKIFHLGIYKDKRVCLSENFFGYQNKLIPSKMLSGGVSAWRQNVFEIIPFDIKNGFHMYEDIDFSTRVAYDFPGQLFINPNARLAHYFSPINRDLSGVRERRKITECCIYYKKRKNWQGSTFPFFWLLFGMFLQSFYQSLKSKSFSPIYGYFLGIRDGYKKKYIRS